MTTVNNKNLIVIPNLDRDPQVDAQRSFDPWSSPEFSVADRKGDLCLFESQNVKGKDFTFLLEYCLNLFDLSLQSLHLSFMATRTQ